MGGQMGTNGDKWVDKWGRSLIVTFFHRLLNKGELIQEKRRQAIELFRVIDKS